MFIKVEDAGFFMYTVKLICDLEKPDSEDQQIRDYLVEHELEPKYQGTGDYEGRNSEMMQFGGCYLGKHLQTIGGIQRHAVETEVLTEEIQKHLNSPHGDESPPDGKSDDNNQHEQIVPQLVQKFHEGLEFQTNELGELTVTLDEKEVAEAAQRLMAERQISD